MRVTELLTFVEERHRIYLRRNAGDSLLTKDPILSKYRFCNIYRELDTVTAWLAKHWREPNADNPDLWHAFVVARHMNNIPMLDALGGALLPWNRNKFVEIAEDRRLKREKVFSGAYMIGTRHNGSKAVYLADMVFTPLWNARGNLTPIPSDTLTSFHLSLCLFYGLAGFISAQVVADAKYAGVLRGARDWHTFAASGPGSRRGLNRVMGRPLRQPWNEDAWRLALARLRDEMLPRFRELGWEEPHAQDVQNMCCEWDKYERARLGEGRPKQLFRGGQAHAIQENEGRKVQVA